MQLKSPEAVADLLENLTYKDTQLQTDGVDLTVNEIYELVDSGDVDFGGGEYREAPMDKIDPSKRSPDDKYGWWNLSPGEYLIKFNEDIKLQGVELAILQPKTWLVRNGCHHPSLAVTKSSQDELSVTLFVGRRGINIKENARLSKLIVVK